MGDGPAKLQVSLVGDFSGTVPPETLVVQSDVDYILAAQLLRDCAGQDKAAGIWVRQKAHYRWLQSYVESVKLRVDFEEKTPRLILADAWLVSIPDWLKDEQVLEQKLLELKLPTQHPDDFATALLAMLLGDHFTKKQISVKDIPDLLRLAFPDNHIQLEKYPVLHRCFEQKCMQWKEASTHSWMEEVFGILQKAPESLWHDLSLWVLLCGYPEKLLAYAIPPHRMALVQQLPPENLAEIKLHGAAVEEAINQLTVFFADVKNQIKTAAHLEKIIGCCSGRLRYEFEQLIKTLHAFSQLVNETHLEEIRRKFSSCPGVSTSDLIKLSTFIVPDTPAMLDEEEVWDANFWREWTAKEYIPYRHWLTENNREDNDLEKTVAAFSDWYLENYTTIHQEVNTSLVHILTAWTDRIRKDELTLIIVVDCLPLTYFHLLLKAFHISGFHKHDQGTLFAPLPSNTETCKNLLLSGDWHVDGTSNYGTIVDQRVKACWPEKEPNYLPNLQAMASSIPTGEKAPVYVLNYIPSDEVMHSNPGLKGMTYEDELLDCFTRLAESAHAFLERSQKNTEDLSIYLVTDHGATRILEFERKSLESTVVDDLFENSRHRFAAVHKEDVNSIPSNLWEIGHRFEPPFGDGHLAYFIPQGHKTVGKKKAATGYVHGGATPEEIIVPFAVFKAVKSKWKEPKGRFVVGNPDPVSKAAIFHVMRIVSIEMAIQNPNPDPLRIVRIEIIKPEASEVREFNSCEIDGNSDKQFDIKCYFKKTATGDDELLLRVIYQYGEEERELVLSLKSIFKTAMTGGFSLKNL